MLIDAEELDRQIYLASHFHNRRHALSKLDIGAVRCVSPSVLPTLRHQRPSLTFL